MKKSTMKIGIANCCLFISSWVFAVPVEQLPVSMEWPIYFGRDAKFAYPDDWFGLLASKEELDALAADEKTRLEYHHGLPLLLPSTSLAEEMLPNVMDIPIDLSVSDASVWKALVAFAEALQTELPDSVFAKTEEVEVALYFAYPADCPSCVPPSVVENSGVNITMTDTPAREVLLGILAAADLDIRYNMTYVELAPGFVQVFLALTYYEDGEEWKKSRSLEGARLKQIREKVSRDQEAILEPMIGDFRERAGQARLKQEPEAED